ncbi:hypothetical protein FQR65_LT16636 [Abscondita terminalis]|nr:hypothetical protein FQR65_LT16636 [Abscondita terminalis]
MSEEMRLERVYENLRAEYKHYIRPRDFSNTNELLEMAAQFEALPKESNASKTPKDTRVQEEKPVAAIEETKIFCSRTLIADQKKTGGGSSQEKSLTTLEERGLAIWGQVAVTGTPKVPAVGGLQHQAQTLEVELIDLSEIEKSIEVVHTSDTEVVDVLDPVIINLPETLPTFSENFINHPTITHAKPQKISENRKRKLLSNNQKIKNIGAELLETYKNDTKRRDENVEIENKKILLEKIRLQFEIAKYKFQNASFQFDVTELSNIK